MARPADPQSRVVVHCLLCGEPNSADASQCHLCGTDLRDSVAALAASGAQSVVPPPRPRVPSATAPVPNTPGDVAGSQNNNADALAPGTLIKGSYRIVRFLGEGGAGAVYVGEHTGLGHLVAIKTLFARYVRDASMHRRFVEEGVIQANLSHPNVVRVTDIVDERGFSAIIMEFVDGGSLEGWLRKQAGRVDVAQMIDVFLGVLGGVGYAHAQGIVHRDIKPANILMDVRSATPVPKVTDFGIAKIVSERRHTETGTTMGTIHYAAPEQLTDAKSVDHRADIYALGCTLYEMLCRKVPFDRDSIYSIMRAHLESPRPDAAQSNADVPRGVALAIRKAMAISADHRYDSCEAFAADLREALLIVPPPSAPSGGAGRSTVDRRPVAERPMRTAAGTHNTPAVGASTAEGRPARTTGAGGGTAARTGPNTPAVTGATTGATARARASARTTETNATTQTRTGDTGSSPRHVQAAIAVLAVLVFAGLAAVVFRSNGARQAEAVVTVQTTSLDRTQTPPAVSTPPPSEVAAALPVVVDEERLQRCRDLPERYTNFDILGDVPIGLAIRELEENAESCRSTLQDASYDTAYDRLVANVRADMLRVELGRLRAMRNAHRGEDACADALTAATESQRTLWRIQDARTSGTLLEFHETSIRRWDELLIGIHSTLRATYEACGIPPLPNQIIGAEDERTRPSPPFAAPEEHGQDQHGPDQPGLDPHDFDEHAVGSPSPTYDPHPADPFDDPAELPVPEHEWAAPAPPEDHLDPFPE